ncbi:hypothetical protein N7474_008493 [Penicillium riverlandense]|uniref:uncharacterized protein n=1 Tax=Penicillium riverlandense TaxID=1903569 RepID=UPI00254840CE|nr:uncharacterized protein N7474_008493 [Penicillium riverlandense]KAJ5812192.1 hypothetical protein N7474_008493 [Penicillium riverlandense]
MAEPNNTLKVKDDIRLAYDDMAPTYLTWTESTHGVRLSYVEAMLKHHSHPNEEATGMNILELGCGAGVPVTELLASRENTSVTANDISAAQIALAKQRLPESVRLIQGDMMDLTFDKEHFDAVLAMYSIIHLPRDEQTTMLHRIYGWLKPGGYFLANFAAQDFEGSSVQSWLGSTKGGMYWSGWGEDKTRAILRDIGFEMVIDEVKTDIEEENGVSREVPFHWVLAKKAV